jgi:integrase
MTDWPKYRMARDLAGKVFPVTEALILQTARKHGIGRKMGRSHIFKAFRVLVIFLLYTGARIGEALWLNWRDVDLTPSHVIFPVDLSDGRRTKNNEPRGVPLHPRLRAALANLPHREGMVFRRPDGMPYERLRDGATSASDGIRKAFAGACKRAGLKNFTVHDCPPYLGLLALREKPRSAGAPEAWRLEDARDGNAIRAHQCR